MPGRKSVRSKFYVASGSDFDSEKSQEPTSEPEALGLGHVKTRTKVVRSTFYVDSIMESGAAIQESFDIPDLDPTLLEGEIIASKAQKVLRVDAYSKKTGQSGHLYCTNFRICFVTASQDPASSGNDGSNHKFLGADDVILSNIAAIYQINKDKTKKLSPTKTKDHGSHCKSIQIHTKDLGIHHFSFQFTEKKERNNLVTAILHHAFPNRHDLLFAYEFSRCDHRNSSNGTTSSKSETSSLGSVSENANIESWRPARYTTRQDWEKELIRLSAKSSWRVPHVNEQYSVSPTMPEYFAAPKDAQDLLLTKAASQFTGNRLPMWCYTHSNGYSLVSMANLTPETIHINVETDAENQLECKRLIDVISEAQPQSEDEQSVKVLDVDLSKEIGESITDIQTAYTKMFSLCIPVTVKDFYGNDNEVYGKLDSSHWLRMISACLKVSKDITRKLRKGLCSVNIREDNAVDLSCIVSSLVQLMLDPTARTIRGFQNIIQRCWVVAGHPFCDRLAILSSGEQVSPVFLLFLDCVYQLTVQYPSAFEFSEIYLISLWDSCGTGLFREFIFNCNKDRKPAKQKFSDTQSARNGSASLETLPSVWSWDIQYNTDYISLFKNPLYEFNTIQSTTTSLPLKSKPTRTIKPNCHLSQIEVWVGCFYRNTAPMQITNGGKPAEYFQQCIIMEEIIELQNQISKLKSGQAQRSSGLFFNASQSASAGDGGLLAKLKKSYITSTFPFNNRISRNVSDISLCTLLERSLVLSDSVNEDD